MEERINNRAKPNRRFSRSRNQKIGENYRGTETTANNPTETVNRKQYTTNYVYSLQYTPPLSEKQSNSKVFSFRVSPKQYAFLKATNDIQTVLRRFIDSLRIEQMPPEDKILVLLNQIEKLKVEMERLEKGSRYVTAKELIDDIPKTIYRETTKEEHDRKFKEKAKEFADFNGETSKSLEDLERCGNFNFWRVLESNPVWDRYNLVILATEKVMAKKRQQIEDLQTEIKVLRNSLKG